MSDHDGFCFLESIKFFKFLRSREAKYIVLEIKVLEVAYLSWFPPQPAPHHTHPCWDTAAGYFSLPHAAVLAAEAQLTFQCGTPASLGMPLISAHTGMERQNPSPVRQGRATSSPCSGALLLLQAQQIREVLLSRRRSHCPEA